LDCSVGRELGNLASQDTNPPETQSDFAKRSFIQARVAVQLLFMVRLETCSTSAVSGTVKPQKYRS